MILTDEALSSLLATAKGYHKLAILMSQSILNDSIC